MLRAFGLAQKTTVAKTCHLH